MIHYNIHWFESLHSTQDYLKNSFDDSLPKWTVFVAKEQIKGKGQGQNVWESEKDKNLTFSILLYPNFLQARDQFLITQILSLGIYDFLSHYLSNVFIKWPNDIYVGKNKICGILVQNQIIGMEYSTAFCGIGLNVNQTEFSFAPNPTSLKLELDRSFDLDILLEEVLDCIRIRYEQLENNLIADYKKEYMEKLLFYKVWSKYLYCDNEIMEAKIKDVDNFGRLILENRGGKEIIADLKQLKFLF
ncbi:Bifunctional ligase/repressor BirA [bioreactor metagenome]|jgi:BirA family biotin operon repressor/biotin-[acetyl-CoA-carboxylase] ligase|uniref:Bifunctional ligase/repressor BirA n=1 Tax=bioreactor metagenome TaxID=1076179 RepID=A0A644UQB4_9ZZZZ|nr:biotin--[acetyl-CoA-carboxylase] ligase [Bacteroidales bacterium]MEA4967902.1 biotin--[acetyl-CoA-carboxylase] ligase [Bacteroidaceae bacterium]MEA5100459.1 biotin--[acetyl-CoA-carboxylase] ligase [Bacteroidales bacterium]NCC17418.1 biotin--[acetyl-CoA-carboxylase] ligase [Bacteroidia bacterium]